MQIQISTEDRGSIMPLAGKLAAMSASNFEHQTVDLPDNLIIFFEISGFSANFRRWDSIPEAMPTIG